MRLVIIWLVSAVAGAGCGGAAVYVPDPGAQLIRAEIMAGPAAMLDRLAVVLGITPESWLDDEQAPELLELAPGDLDFVGAGDLFLPKDAETPEMRLVATVGDSELYALLAVDGALARTWPVVWITEGGRAEVVAANLRDFLAESLDEPVLSDEDSEHEAVWQLRRIQMWEALQLGPHAAEERSERTRAARLAWGDFWAWPADETPEATQP